jgi:membrane AbrB-like protein
LPWVERQAVFGEASMHAWLTRARSWTALAIVSLALGATLQWAAFPAALMVGPLIAGAAFALSGVRLQLPRAAFIAAQAVIGCLVARAVTTSILVSLARDWAPMLLVVSATVLAGALVGWVLVRLRVLPGTTAAWGSAPGGASAMIAMAGEFGADIRLVAFMQYLRVVLVVLTASLVSRALIGVVPAATPPAGLPLQVPVAASIVPELETLALAAVGAWLGWRLRLPAGGLIIPMVLGASLHAAHMVEIILPPWLLAATYTALGWYVGLGFSREVVGYAFRAIPQLLLAAGMLIALCAASAFMLTVMLHTDPLTAYLATSPGGIDTIAIISVGSQANVPFVLAAQALRVFAVILTGAPIARLISRHAATATDSLAGGSRISCSTPKGT